MILRLFQELLHESDGTLDLAGNPLRNEMLDELDGALRFVFKPGAFEACQQIADRPQQLVAARTQLFAPWPRTWIEWEGHPCAMFWLAADELGRRGTALIVLAHGSLKSIIPMEVDLDTEALLVLAPAAREPDTPWGREDMTVAETEAFGLLFGRLMLAGWALLATKSMTASVTPDLSRLNRARQRRGLFPLLAATEIRLNLDVQRAIKAKTAVGTGQMPEHAVRAHLRLLASGKVVLVKPHMRGNPEFGTRTHRYTVGRDEDFKPS